MISTMASKCLLPIKQLLDDAEKTGLSMHLSQYPDHHVNKKLAMRNLWHYN